MTSLTKSSGKDAELVCTGFDELEADTETQSLLNDITVQLLRNAMSHGIETEDVRALAKKTPVARVDCRIARVANELELVFEDDGAGFNYEKIRQKALSMNKWDEAEIASWSTNKLVSLLFTAGFSTADESSLDAGRGIGMDIIKQRIQEADGKISISSRPGKFTRFVVHLPIKNEELLAA
ncbi:MAG: hypothetical protein HRU20_31430 [Pseudomonadales bacterium]|nr:hypothetical protein [Pseudomonadales bacterium]